MLGYVSSSMGPWACCAAPQSPGASNFSAADCMPLSSVPVADMFDRSPHAHTLPCPLPQHTHTHTEHHEAIEEPLSSVSLDDDAGTSGVGLAAAAAVSAAMARAWASAASREQIRCAVLGASTAPALRCAVPHMHHGLHAPILCCALPHMHHAVHAASSVFSAWLPRTCSLQPARSVGRRRRQW